MDFRAEITEMLKQDGIEVLYRRKSKMAPCVCLNKLHNAGDPACEVCLGTGKMISFEKMTILFNPKNPGAGGIQQTKIGNAYNAEQIVISSHDKYLAPNDLIYIVGWRHGAPVTLHRVLKLHYAESLRQQGGRVEYNLGYADIDADEFQMAKKTLSKIIGRDIEVRE